MKSRWTAVAVMLAAVALLAPRVAAWEVVSKYTGTGFAPDSQTLNTFVSVPIRQHVFNLKTPFSDSFEAFTVHIIASTTPATRHVVVFYDLADAGIQLLVQRMRDGYNTGKKLYVRASHRDGGVWSRSYTPSVSVLSPCVRGLRVPQTFPARP
jgi:hypothetical protein